MQTLKDIVNRSTEEYIALEDCTVIKQNKNGTYNVTCTIAGKKVFINYVNAALCKDTLHVKYGKKEGWNKAYWYQVEDEEAETETEKEDK